MQLIMVEKTKTRKSLKTHSMAVLFIMYLKELEIFLCGNFTFCNFQKKKKKEGEMKRCAPSFVIIVI